MNMLPFTDGLPPNVIIEFSGEYGFLSNYARCDIELDGETYRTVEHAYQAAKTLDLNWRAAIRSLSHPQWAKNRGKRLPIRDGWESMRHDILVSLLRQKFAQPKFRAKLMATGTRHIIDSYGCGDNWWDVCVDQERTHQGGNRLGIMLMQIRDELRADQGNLLHLFAAPALRAIKVR